MRSRRRRSARSTSSPRWEIRATTYRCESCH
ncbi:MAG: CxxxxCH/CxxCH domain-containing protein [Cellulomonas sp.]|nr:CxxxxCH/CxxCH domain-containing protein [Cellulomonas sp.]